MAEKVTIGNCELWHGDCRRIEQAYAQPRLFEDAKSEEPKQDDAFS